MNKNIDIEKLLASAVTPELNHALREKVLNRALLIERGIRRETRIFRVVRWVMAASVLLTILFNFLTAAADKEIRALTEAGRVKAIEIETELREEFGFPTELAQRTAERNEQARIEECLKNYLRK